MLIGIVTILFKFSRTEDEGKYKACNSVIQFWRCCEYWRKDCGFTVMLRWTEILYRTLLLSNIWIFKKVFILHPFYKRCIYIHTQILLLRLFCSGFPDPTGVIDYVKATS